MEVPNLVISVTGGAKDFKLKPRLEDEFSKGLIKVAISTGAWVITGKEYFLPLNTLSTEDVFDKVS